MGTSKASNINEIKYCSCSLQGTDLLFNCSVTDVWSFLSCLFKFSYISGRKTSWTPAIWSKDVGREGGSSQIGKNADPSREKKKINHSKKNHYFIFFIWENLTIKLCMAIILYHYSFVLKRTHISRFQICAMLPTTVFLSIFCTPVSDFVDYVFVKPVKAIWLQIISTNYWL